MSVAKRQANDAPTRPSIDGAAARDVSVGDTEQSIGPRIVSGESTRENGQLTRERQTLEVVLLWRDVVMSVEHYNRARTVYVGEHKKNDFRIATDKIKQPRFPLVDVHDGQLVVQWCAPEMTAKVRNTQAHAGSDGTSALSHPRTKQSESQADGVFARHAIGLDDRVAVHLGDLTFIVRFVSPARIVQTSILRSIDYYFTKVLSLSFFGHLFFLLALFVTPVTVVDHDEQLFENPNRFAKLLLTEIPEQRPQESEISGTKSGGTWRGSEGKLGESAPAPRTVSPSTKGAPRIDPSAVETDRQIAEESGILKALKGAESTAASDVLGPGGLASGVTEALGGLSGPEPGLAGGSNAMGIRGSQSGGGGSTLGIGGLGSGVGQGAEGIGDVELGGVGRSRFVVTPGRTVSKGCLPPAVVERVIGRSTSRVRFCYEKGLQRDPSLAGKLNATFTVGPTGSVLQASISQSSMGDLEVEQCVVRVIRQMRFPPCAGGGVVEVNRPWLFRPSGE